MSNEGIPETTWKKVQEIHARGGAAQLEQLQRSLTYLSASLDSVVTALQDNLTKEKQEDDSMRTIYQQKWTRYPSEALTPQFWAEITRFKDSLL